MRNNFLILMSGGTTPVINSTLFGIIEKIKKKSSKIKIFSGYPGIDGVLKNNFIDLTKFSKSKLKKISAVVLDTRGVERCVAAQSRKRSMWVRK